MQRLIIQMAQGVDHTGADPQRAAARAVKRAAGQASIAAPETLGIPAEDILVRITLGVPSGVMIDTEALVGLNRLGRTTIAVTQGGLRVTDSDSKAQQIVITAAAEVFVPRQNGFVLRDTASADLA